MKANAKLSVIFAIVVAAVLLGEVYVYTFNTSGYSSDVSVSGDVATYTVTSDVSTTYSVIITDNGGFEPNTEYYIYYDSSYGSEVNAVEVPVGARPFTQDYYISQLVHMLEYRGITNVTILNAEELRSKLHEDTDNKTCTKGLIVLSGALPDTIYTGNAGGLAHPDLIFDWLNGGGRLYWAGNLLGRYIATKGGVTDIGADNNDYQSLFFGATCLNTGSTDTAYSDETDNQYRSTLSLMNNSVKYGVDVSVLTDVSLRTGYREDGYSSIAMVAHGSNGGMICVLGGDYSSNQRHDLAQMISSGLSYASETIGYATGTLKRTTVHGTINLDHTPGPGDNVVAYVYYGGYFPIYGKLMELAP